jgi:subtilisin family serine protease
LRALLLTFLASAAQAQVSPWVHLVAERHLPLRSLGDGLNDLAVVTARPASRLRGFDARLLGGDVALLRLTADELRALTAIPGVQVEERRLFRTQLDRASASIGAPAARAESGLDGSGALIGIVDTGADFTHGDLRRADGTSKIAALFDVTLPDDHRHGDLGSWGGLVRLRDDIDSSTSIDNNGHGTHVAAIAAGSGLATGNGFPSGRYTGIAPGADLLIAKASHGRGEFYEGELLESCNFLIDMAAILGRPLVVNLSLGGTGGAHDGTSNTELALEALFPADARGRVLVVAAGNEGLTDRHAGGWSLDGDVEIPIHIFQPDPDRQVAIDVWTLDSPSITVISPSGRQLGPIAGKHVDHNEGTEGTIAVDHTQLPRSDGRQPSAIVLMPNTGSALASGDWRIRLSGQARRWDLWITEAAGDAHFTDHLDEDQRLGILATTRSAISVGSYVSRSAWTTVDGMPYDRKLELGVPSLFSSTGPSADGRFVPDLVAPGEFVIAALSKDALPDQPMSDFFVGAGSNVTWADDGVHGVLRGTSQAAPMVAGAVALMLQFDGSLTSRQVRELLRASARDAGSGWSPRSGFGFLDVPALLAALRGRVGDTVDPDTSSVGVSRDQLPPGDEITTVTVTPRDAQGLPLGPRRNVTITVSAGEPGPVTDVGLGRYEMPVRAHAGRGQVGIVSATVDGVPLNAHPRIYYVIGRDEIGRPFSAGGGCESGGGASADGGGGTMTGLLLLATLLWLRKSQQQASRSPRARGSDEPSGGLPQARLADGCSPKPPRL